MSSEYSRLRDDLGVTSQYGGLEYDAKSREADVKIKKGDLTLIDSALSEVAKKKAGKKGNPEVSDQSKAVWTGVARQIQDRTGGSISDFLPQIKEQMKTQMKKKKAESADTIVKNIIVAHYKAKGTNKEEALEKALKSLQARLGGAKVSEILDILDKEFPHIPDMIKGLPGLSSAKKKEKTAEYNQMINDEILLLMVEDHAYLKGGVTQFSDRLFGTEIDDEHQKYRKDQAGKFKKSFVNDILHNKNMSMDKADLKKSPKDFFKLISGKINAARKEVVFEHLNPGIDVNNIYYLPLDKQMQILNVYKLIEHLSPVFSEAEKLGIDLFDALDKDNSSNFAKLPTFQNSRKLKSYELATLGFRRFIGPQDILSRSLDRFGGPEKMAEGLREVLENEKKEA